MLYQEKLKILLCRHLVIPDIVSCVPALGSQEAEFLAQCHYVEDCRAHS